MLKASNPQHHPKNQWFFSMFLHLRHLLIIDSLIFESCLNKSLFWRPNSPKIHLQTHEVYHFVDDCFLSQLLFDLGGLWGGFGKFIGGSQTHFWDQNGGFGTPWSLSGAAFFLSEPQCRSGTQREPSITLLIFTTEPLRSQFASKNELQILENQSKIHQSSIIHACLALS